MNNTSPMRRNDATLCPFNRIFLGTICRLPLILIIYGLNEDRRLEQLKSSSAAVKWSNLFELNYPGCRDKQEGIPAIPTLNDRNFFTNQLSEVIGLANWGLYRCHRLSDVSHLLVRTICPARNHPCQPGQMLMEDRCEIKDLRS
jgi:hypothetical protein